MKEHSDDEADKLDILLSILRSDVLASHLIIVEELRSFQKKPFNYEYETRRYLSRRNEAYTALQREQDETLARIRTYNP